MRALLLSALALTLAAALPASAAPKPATVALEATLEQPLLIAGATFHGHVIVHLTALERGAPRPRMNIAFVLDRSHGMDAAKMAHIRSAVGAALDELGPDDVVSVVVFNDTVEVLVPATRVRDRAAILAELDRLEGAGRAALFAGASKGAAEVRKFRGPGTLDRVILLSEARADVGPVSVDDLASLGAALAREGIAVTTVGLGGGFDEDSLIALSRRSGGRHYFVERSAELPALFRAGVAGLATIVAEQLTLEVAFDPSYRPLRALGHDADVAGASVTVTLPQLYAGERDELVFAFDGTPPEASGAVAQVTLRYRLPGPGARGVVARSLHAEPAADPGEAEAAMGPGVGAAVEAVLAAEARASALHQRDRGNVDLAHATLLEAAARLRVAQGRLAAPRLGQLAQLLTEDAEHLAGERWSERRKVILEHLHARPQHRRPGF